MDYIWRETRSKLVQFIDTSSTCESDSAQSREWLDFQSILISLLRTAFPSSSSRGALFQAMLSTITPVASTSDEGEGGSGIDELSELEGRRTEELSVLDVWLLLALAGSPQYKTKIHTCLIKQVRS